MSLDPWGFISLGGTGGDGLSQLGIPPWRDDSVRVATGDDIAALADVIRIICRDAGELFIYGDLTEQIEHHRCVAGVAPVISTTLISDFS